MAQLRVLLQEPEVEVEPEPEVTTVLLADFLRVKMDGPDERIGRRKSLRERLGLKRMSCCGAASTTDVVAVDFAAGPAPSGSVMSLEAALAAERHLRAAAPRDGGDVAEVGSDTVCCVCMGRKKGAALIPCGHTFCRVCSREVWAHRGSCPICNRPILQILHIF